MNRTTFFLMVSAVAMTFYLGTMLAPKGHSDRDLADAVRRAGDSATARITDNVAGIIPGLQDSIQHYRAQALASTVVEVVRTDTLETTDTVEVVPDGAPYSTIIFPPMTRNGLTVVESLQIRPAPLVPTNVQRRLHINVASVDTVLVALLRAVIPERKDRRWGIGLTVGYGATLSGGVVYAGPSVTAGFSYRF